jgi:hypothetical protein
MLLKVKALATAPVAPVAPVVVFNKTPNSPVAPVATPPILREEIKHYNYVLYIDARTQVAMLTFRSHSKPQQVQQVAHSNHLKNLIKTPPVAHVKHTTGGTVQQVAKPRWRNRRP